MRDRKLRRTSNHRHWSSIGENVKDSSGEAGLYYPVGPSEAHPAENPIPHDTYSRGPVFLGLRNAKQNPPCSSPLQAKPSVQVPNLHLYIRA
ncbi:hypothetical protein F2Q70_00004785 [Brassica cretica]|uniref:Uncharacterized protein n=1 Tax=Brassica cretica TaxID=69181 RepID=A0A8S9IUZ5_BRACR|nr:hypothetical protein F2Q70_00004785 [Brassica cretica]